MRVVDMSNDIQGQIQQLGRGLVQVNLRLNRVLELLEAERAPAGGGDLRDVLLDLVDALTLATTLPARRRRGAFAWLLPPAPSGELEAGVRMARERALARLSDQGLLPVPAEGAFDAALHQVVDRRPTADPARHHTIATVHRPGWMEERAGERRVIRPALVSVYAHQEG